MTHEELCYATAKWSITPPAAACLALYEYQSYASQEFPDVLTYHCNGTTLYEIKMSHSDFIADLGKEARVMKGEYSAYAYIQASVREILERGKKRKDALYIDDRFKWKLENISQYNHCLSKQDKTYQEAPHLGEARFYVCPGGIIAKDEVPEGWGLIYLDDRGQFRQILSSGKWKANIRAERDIIAHALRKLGNGVEQGILIHKW
jgi:hypothetical protein